MKCILIHKTPFDKNNISNTSICNYTDDIDEIIMTDLPIPTVNRYDEIVKCGHHKTYYNNIFNHLNDPKIFLGWSKCVKYPGLPQLLVLSPRPKKLNIEHIAHMEKLYRGPAPKAMAINKKHRMWTTTIFCMADGKPLTKNDFLKYYDKSKYTILQHNMREFNEQSSPKNEQERYMTAQKYLTMLYDSCIGTYEGIWILLAKEMADIYVKKGYGHYQNNICHSFREYYKYFFKLDKGTKPNPDYNMFEAANHDVKPIHPTMGWKRYKKS